MTDFVLWGKKYVPVIIKITGGTKSHCETQRRIRESETGWVDLQVIPRGQRPTEGGK